MAAGIYTGTTGLSMTADNQLYAAFNLKALNIKDDYLGGFWEQTRRIKQIKVTLLALAEPYQDMWAIFRYGGTRCRPAAKPLRYPTVSMMTPVPV